MKRLTLLLLVCVALIAGCRHSATQAPKPAAYGTQIVEISGGKQLAQVGSPLPQPLVLQVNGADGNPVTGALVVLHGDGVQFAPAQAMTDSSGQVTVAAQLGYNPGDYQMTAETPKSGGGSATLNLREIALGYEQTVGKTLNDKYCIRCHDPESTPETIALSPRPASKGALIPSFIDAIVEGRDAAPIIQSELDVIAACVAADHAVATDAPGKVVYV